MTRSCSCREGGTPSGARPTRVVTPRSPSESARALLMRSVKSAFWRTLDKSNRTPGNPAPPQERRLREKNHLRHARQRLAFSQQRTSSPRTSIPAERRSTSNTAMRISEPSMPLHGRASARLRISPRRSCRSPSTSAPHKVPSRPTSFSSHSVSWLLPPKFSSWFHYRQNRGFASIFFAVISANCQKKASASHAASSY